MENVQNLNNIEDGESEDEIFFGPITKKEILARLKHFNINDDKLVDPLNDLDDNKELEDDLIEYYYNEVFPKCDNLEEKQLCDQSFPSNFQSVLNDTCNSEKLNSVRCSSSEEHEKSVHNQHLNKSECNTNTSRNFNIFEKEENDTKCLINKYSISNLESPKFVSLDCSNDSENTYPNNDISSLNCTLEEMELLMKYRENYIHESSEINTKSKVDKQSNMSNDDLSFSDNKENNCLNLEEKNLDPPSTNKEDSNKILETPKRVLSKISANERFETENLKVSSKFKTPTATSHLKSHFNVPNKMLSAKKPPNFKNVVSPIALYIKNSPHVPLVKNVTKRTIQMPTFKEPNKKISEVGEEMPLKAKPVLPARTYKPAACSVLLSKESEPTLPDNIRRLFKGSVNPEVIKHVGRTNSTPDKYIQTSDSQYKQEDITMLSSSVILEGDMSIHISKNAVKSNLL